MKNPADLTVKELAKRLGIAPIHSNSLLLCLRQLGKARIVSHQTSPSGRGRAAAVWRIEQPLQILIPDQPIPPVPLHLRLPKKMLRFTDATFA